MLTTGTQNLPEPLARVRAAYHGTARLAPASADRLGRRVEHLIGMASTHFQRPHRPSDHDLRIMELYADFAGEALIAHLGRPSGEGPADPAGPARRARLTGRSP